MSGAEIKQVLEDAVARSANNSSHSGAFPYAYALRYDVIMSNETGNRVLNLEIKNRITSQWSSINLTNNYVISTLNYLASGKDGYETFKTVQNKEGKGVDTYLDYALSFVKYVKSKTVLDEKLIKLPSAEHCIKSFKK